MTVDTKEAAANVVLQALASMQPQFQKFQDTEIMQGSLINTLINAVYQLTFVEITRRHDEIEFDGLMQEQADLGLAVAYRALLLLKDGQEGGAA